MLPSLILKASRKASVSLIGCEACLVGGSSDRHAMPVPVLPSAVHRWHSSPDFRPRASSSLLVMWTLKAPSSPIPRARGRTVKRIGSTMVPRRSLAMIIPGLTKLEESICRDLQCLTKSCSSCSIDEIFEAAHETDLQHQSELDKEYAKAPD